MKLKEGGRMRKELFFILLLVLGGLSIACDLAFVVYLGVTISQVLNGILFLPTIFPTLAIALAVINGVTILYSLVYIFILRK